jgi:hypothetical protein
MILRSLGLPFSMSQRDSPHSYPSRLPTPSNPYLCHQIHADLVADNPRSIPLQVGFHWPLCDRNLSTEFDRYE